MDERELKLNAILTDFEMAIRQGLGKFCKEMAREQTMALFAPAEPSVTGDPETWPDKESPLPINTKDNLWFLEALMANAIMNGRIGDRAKSCANLAHSHFAPMVEKLAGEALKSAAYTDMLSNELAQAQEDRDGWHKVVTDCEEIFECPDTAESALYSNLPNLVRDLVYSDRGQLKHGLTLKSQELREAQREIDALKAAKPEGEEWWVYKTEVRPDILAFSYGYRSEEICKRLHPDVPFGEIFPIYLPKPKPERTERSEHLKILKDFFSDGTLTMGELAEAINWAISELEKQSEANPKD